jgi:hypothetical protein
LLWRLLGGAGWSARDDARWEALVHEGVGGAGSLLTGLVRLVRPPDGLGWWLLVAVVLAAVAVLRGDDLARRRRLVLTAAVVSLAGWLLTSQTVRYAFPVAAMLAVLAAVGMRWLPRWAAATAAAIAAVTVVLGVTDLASFTFGRLEIQRIWSGEATREEWRHRVTVNDPLPAYRAAEDGLLPSARLLVVGEGRSWGCRVPHHVSSPYDLQLVQDWVESLPDSESVARAAASEGWSHLLINWGELARLGGPDFQVLRSWKSGASVHRSTVTTEHGHARDGPCQMPVPSVKGSPTVRGR